MIDAELLLAELVKAPGPPGQEDAVLEVVARYVGDLGLAASTDARGNLLVMPRHSEAVPDRARIVVMAHLDEIALIVTRIDPDGRLRVDSIGGLFAWKWGESPVQILAPGGLVTGVLSFGSIHSLAPENPAVRAKTAPVGWGDVRVTCGLSAENLVDLGVKPGTRVVLHPSRREPTVMENLVAGNFLDDRADLVAWLLALETLSRRPDGPEGVVFAATAAEEVGGHGAQYLLRHLDSEVGIALEIGPNVPEAPLTISDQPTVWTNDSYSAMRPADVELVARAAAKIGIAPQWQALARGGSDASCAASHGLLARPITLAFAAENSHGYEIMHRNAPRRLAELTVAVLDELANGVKALG